MGRSEFVVTGLGADALTCDMKAGNCVHDLRLVVEKSLSREQLMEARPAQSEVGSSRGAPVQAKPGPKVDFKLICEDRVLDNAESLDTLPCKQLSVVKVMQNKCHSCSGTGREGFYSIDGALVGTSKCDRCNGEGWKWPLPCK